MTLFRRSSAVSCYYCLSLIDPSVASSSRAGPFDATSFRCPYCACWNRYDSRGQIIGEEPAMHDEKLNAESFSRRGLPNRNHLPSLAGQRTSSVFCRTCQTNQTLLINLRAAYLPASEDPSYPARLEQLPAYIASLQSRYPPVCPSCQPGVDAEIARKDEFARTRALAGALKATSRPASRNGNSRTSVKSNRFRLLSWRIRGVLWTASCATVILANTAALLQLEFPALIRRIMPLLPFLVLISVAWTFWDPTYSLQQKSHVQGQKMRVEGRQRYIVLQTVAWVSRLATSVLLFCSWISLEWDVLHIRASSSPNDILLSRRQSYFGAALVLELSVLILSYFAITIHRPVPIRLIDTSVHRALANSPTTNTNGKPTAPHANGMQPEPDFFSTLSLSANPVITPVGVNPMFGQPSFAPGQRSSERDNRNGKAELNLLDDRDEFEDDNALPRSRQRDPDAMDWEPSTPAKQAAQAGARGRSTDDGTWLRQQRFFPPEEPTGLESLFMRTRLVDELDGSGRQTDGSDQTGRNGRGTRWHWGWVYSASLVPLVALLAALWVRSRL